MKERGYTFWIPTPVLAELSTAGASLAELAKAISPKLNGLRTVEFGVAAAESCGQMVAARLAASKTGGTRYESTRAAMKFDAMIAAIAHTLQAKYLLTANPRDFASLQGGQLDHAGSSGRRSGSQFRLPARAHPDRLGRGKSRRHQTPGATEGVITVDQLPPTPPSGKCCGDWLYFEGSGIIGVPGHSFAGAAACGTGWATYGHQASSARGRFRAGPAQPFQRRLFVPEDPHIRINSGSKAGEHLGSFQLTVGHDGHPHRHPSEHLAEPGGDDGERAALDAPVLGP
jgi:hypothetical protein